MAEVSKISIGGTLYDVKDETARSNAASKVSKSGDTITGDLTISGVTTSNNLTVTDGATFTGTTTGIKLNDLAQETTDTIIFNCGNASSV